MLVLVVHPSAKSPTRFQIIKLPLLEEPTIGVFLDQASQSLFLLTESLAWR